jgi:PBSX family phage terminase large subunit
MMEDNQKILFLRKTLTSAYLSIIPEFLEKIDLLGLSSVFDVTKTEIVNKQNGNVIYFRGIQTGSKDNTANLKSLQGVNVMVLDEAEELTDEGMFDRIDLSIRQKGVVNKVIIVMNPAMKSHWVYKRFFEPQGLEDEFNGEVENVNYIHTTYEDNIDNLDQGFIDQVESLRLKNLRKFNYIVKGHWASVNQEDALWSDTIIEENRVQEKPTMKRIVVALDPAVTANDTSDETGIIVAGIGFDNHLYVLEDITGTYTPTDWCKQAVMAYNKWKADRVIGEVNNGGDLIETLLRTVSKNIPYTGVHATRDKLTRAEPVSALYEQGKGHHVGIFPELEFEMTNWAAKQGDKSPNRIDALVWAAAELLPEMNKKKSIGIRAFSVVR